MALNPNAEKNWALVVKNSGMDTSALDKKMDEVLGTSGGSSYSDAEKWGRIEDYSKTSGTSIKDTIKKILSKPSYGSTTYHPSSTPDTSDDMEWSKKLLGIVPSALQAGYKAIDTGEASPFYGKGLIGSAVDTLGNILLPDSPYAAPVTKYLGSNLSSLLDTGSLNLANIPVGSILNTVLKESDYMNPATAGMVGTLGDLASQALMGTGIFSLAAQAMPIGSTVADAAAAGIGGSLGNFGALGLTTLGAGQSDFRNPYSGYLSSIPMVGQVLGGFLDAIIGEDTKVPYMGYDPKTRGKTSPHEFMVTPGYGVFDEMQMARNDWYGVEDAAFWRLIDEYGSKYTDSSGKPIDRSNAKEWTDPKVQVDWGEISQYPNGVDNWSLETYSMFQDVLSKLSGIPQEGPGWENGGDKWLFGVIPDAAWMGYLNPTEKGILNRFGAAKQVIDDPATYFSLGLA